MIKALIFTLIFPLSLLGESKITCVSEILGESVIELNQLEGVNLHNYRFNLKNVLGNDSGIVIGFNDGGHSYLMVDGIRYDGELYGGSGTVRSGTQVADKGTIIQLKNISPEVVLMMRNQLLGRKDKFNWSLSCVHGMCEQLKLGGGIIVPGDPFLPSKIMENILAKGLIDFKGHPIEIKAYKVGADVPLSSIRASYIVSEIFLITATTLIAVLPPSIVYMLVIESI